MIQLISDKFIKEYGTMATGTKVPYSFKSLWGTKHIQALKGAEKKRYSSL